jgi:hypothetical protein
MIGWVSDRQPDPPDHQPKQQRLVAMLDVASDGRRPIVPEHGQRDLR